MSGDQELLLFVDQLEELFTQGFADGDIRNFLEQLVATSRDKKNRFRVIASLRSEFIARLEESDSVRALLNAGYNFHLGPVSPKVLANIIEKPARPPVTISNLSWSTISCAMPRKNQEACRW